RRRVVRRDRQRLMQQFESLVGFAWHHRLIGMLLCPHEKVVGIEAIGALAFGSFDLGVAQVWFDRAHDAERQLVLHLEDVIKRAIVTLGPYMGAAHGFDQLRRHAYAVTRLAQAAFKYIART